MNPSQRTLELLRRYESPNILFVDPDGSWPIVWDRARGVHVWDLEGEKYLDLTAAFGVAAAGHANPRIVRAGQDQMSRLLHAMGDVHPHEGKARLAQELSRLTFERWTTARVGKSAAPSHAKTIFGNSGFEAVEAALKTSCLATGRRGVIAFEGAYHGLGYGALNATYRSDFRQPFISQLGQFGHFLPFPTVPPQVCGEPKRARGRGKGKGSEVSVEQTLEKATRLCRKGTIGAVLIEPVQGRGGIRVPDPNLLPALRTLCDEYDVLLVTDEIYTGFGRTGQWFACEHTNVVPDLVCLGKALTGGFPLSACVGKAGLLDRAWPPSRGEAIHTSTFLGHPVGCAMALAQIAEIESAGLVDRSKQIGQELRTMLASLASIRPEVQLAVQGLGLMIGLSWRQDSGEFREVMPIVKAMLRRHFIMLPEGARGEVLAFTPPLTITRTQLRSAVDALAKVLEDRQLWS